MTQIIRLGAPSNIIDRPGIAPWPSGSEELSEPDLRHNVYVDVDVDHGGRVAQIRVGEVSLLIDPPVSVDRADGPADQPVAWGSYPMAPWAGRVRNGRFSFFGSDHQLRLHPGTPNAMHGTVLDAPWVVDDQTDSTVDLTCPLDQPDTGWHLGGIAHQRIEVGDRRLRFEFSVSTGGQPFPAVIGWHPWWRKPDRLTFEPHAMYERDASGLPTGQLIAPPTGPWDDCFVNTKPITLHYDRTEVADVTLSSDCDHWVVYDMPDHSTCVEPQSGPPDEFNLRAQIVTSDRPLRRTMLVEW